MDKEPTPAWADKEMEDVNAERSRLVEATGPQEQPAPAAAAAALKPRVVSLLALLAGSLLAGAATYYSFRDGVTLFSFHPLAMSVGWLVLMPLAISALRAGDLTALWLPLKLRSTRHWVLQGAAATLISAGFIAIVINKIKLGKNHFTTFHGIFGLISIICMFITLSGGIAALYSIKLKELLPPVYTKLIHGLAGLITFCLGVVTICLGVFSHVIADKDIQLPLLGLAVCVAILIVPRPAVETYVRLRERLGYIH